MAVKGRVTVAWLDPGTVASDFAVSMLELYRTRTARMGDRLTIRSGGGICRGRNRSIAEYLRRSRDEWLLLVDSDMTFEPFAFDVVADSAHADKYPVVGGLCFAQEGQLGPFAGLMPTLFKDSNNGGGYTPMWDYPMNKLVEVDATGAAFVLIHRRVLETIRDQQGLGDWSWFGESPNMTVNNWVSEDVTFCKRIKAAGFPIHVHTGSRIGHVKGINYTLDEPMYRLLMASRNADT